MTQVKKATIGIRPVRKMFRVTSLAGLLMDQVISLREHKDLSENYFDKTNMGVNNTAVRIFNEKLGNYLIVDVDNVTFSKDLYNSEKQFSFDDFLRDFRIIWQEIDAVLKMRDIRRIGYVVEHRIHEKDSPGNRLLEGLTKFKVTGHADKFSLHFEERNFDESGKPADVEKGGFVNIIRDIYDSKLDVENPDQHNMNFNIDVQRYYAPVFNGNVSDEVLKLHNKVFAEAEKDYTAQLKKLGLIDAAEKK